MIDWLDFVLPVVHDPIPAGRVISLTHSGEMEYDIPKRLRIEGSFSSSLLVRSQGGDGTGRATELFISGNPAKFLQGHNIFGPDDICSLAAGVTARVCEALNIDPAFPVAQAKRGTFQVKRIDITHSFAFQNRPTVRAVLASLSITSRSRMGRPIATGSTVYHCKNSRRYTVKFYAKGDEINVRGHQLPDELKVTDLPRYADNLLRVELTLRSMELKRLGATDGASFTPQRLDQLFTEYFGKIEMSAQADIPSEVIEHMPRAIRSTYLLWKEGINVQPMMSKQTFYRHRHDLLGYGIDIAMTKEQDSAQVIPLFRTVIGEPVTVPDWAYSQNLIFRG